MFARRRWPVRVAALRMPRRAAHSAAARADESSWSAPYGEEYGAGPSRLPYQPPAVSQAMRRTRMTARDLRTACAKLDADQPDKLSGPRLFFRSLGVDPRQLSRLERHALIHQLLRCKRHRLALAIATNTMEAAVKDRLARRIWSTRTLLSLTDYNYARTSPKATHEGPTNTELARQPTIEEQRAPRLPPDVERILKLMDSLQKVRQRRPEQLFNAAIRQCLAAGRPDEAAKVYVALVEEWIVEGRSAEGAQPGDFYAGGGPPREPRRTTPILSLWFSGVRTWRMPGEALSPHDRLDLWHPHHHSLPERLRGFPMPVPTSPPSLVPHPSLQLLVPILKSLSQDPKASHPADYASSMRALATLANTVLSRTLPVPAIPALLKAFSDSHTLPAVYPDSFETVPDKESWAYTANTQVHVALVSLMFSPPNYASAAEIERKYSTSEEIATEKSGPAMYVMGPLGWRSCLVLVSYALDKLRQPRILSRLFDYMTSVFTITSPRILNKLYRGATLAQDNEMAQVVEDTLFGSTPLARKPKAPYTGAAYEAALREAADSDAVVPDAHSLSALVNHLAATSQFERLENLVYTIIPFLAVSSITTPAEMAQLAAKLEGEIGYSGRLKPSDLTPHLYTSLVNALQKGGRTGLAQRVYDLAYVSERRQLRKDRDEGRKQHLTLPVALFTSMVKVYGNEARKVLHNGVWTQFPEGWRAVDNKHNYITRSQAGEMMVWQIYDRSRRRWQMIATGAVDVDALDVDVLPDTRFFDSVTRALKKRWHLHDDAPLGRQQHRELSLFLHDMEELGLPVPAGLLSKLEAQSTHGRPIYHDRYMRTRTLAAPRPTSRRTYVPTRRAIERADFKPASTHTPASSEPHRDYHSDTPRIA